MNILAVNCGSSSVKYKLYRTDKNLQLLGEGLAERIGLRRGQIYVRFARRKPRIISKTFKDHGTAIKYVFEILQNDKDPHVSDLGLIGCIGHRVVHGGAKYRQPVLIDKQVIRAIRANARFAPLHNHLNLAGIEICRKMLPGVPNVAVFDTGIYRTLPAKSYLYGLAEKFYRRYGIHRYGFQGISHGYVAAEAAKIINRPFENLKIITCHLGNGSSVSAFENGRCIDTSMGMTPLEGLVMATRCGDIDAGVLLYLQDTLGFDTKQMGELLNKKSGLLGLCGKSDIRDILELVKKGNTAARNAIEVFIYRIQKYIGSYTAAMNGVDIIVFTAGIGQNSPYLRERILETFEFLHLRINKARNLKNQTVFSENNSEVCAMRIATDEELAIARSSLEIINSRKGTC
ncbi:MAG TPA: acetate kinase [Sedimentisphaerales bacterium]|nr:acetate kinase [Sedimentisphaerales bacterium]